MVINGFHKMSLFPSQMKLCCKLQFRQYRETKKTKLLTTFPLFIILRSIIHTPCCHSCKCNFCLADK